nr:reverse transcriptase domain-containing protein [Tanacetum cinerariifolium]
MPPKRMSTSEAPAMTQAAIRQLVVDSVAIALETQEATMANTDNANRNPKSREAHVARKCSYKEFMSYQPFNFKSSEGAIGLIRWFERTESVFSHSNYTEDCKKMEDDVYHLALKGDDLKTYVRRFQELATLCPTMVSNFEKLLEAFIEGLSRSIEGNVTASKPQTLEEAINIAQRLMDQGCTLTLLSQPFEIDLMPIKLDSFNVVIGMDWLSKNHAKILCDEKVVHIPIDGETLIIRVTPTEPIDSLSMGNVHLDTISAIESDEFIKSCVENLIDFLFDEFAGELTLLKSIPPGIDETNCHPEKEIRLTKRLLYDNSSPRPPKEIDLSFNLDDPMPPGIKDDDYDSGRDISILEELINNYSLSLPANESYHFDIPSPHRPPAKPSDGNTGTLNIKMLGDVSD